jgi:predicted ABC-type ATPase
MSATPHVVVIAGPNGAGKSTVAPVLLQDLLEIETFVNVAVIARGLSAFAPEKVSIQAGKIMLEQLHRLASARETFAFETTLASRTFAPFLRNLKKDSYFVSLIFLYLESPELAVQRVAMRVRSGGHPIPEADVTRRYETGLTNFSNLYKPLADDWSIWNTSTTMPTLIAREEREEKDSSFFQSTEPLQKALSKATNKALGRHKRLGESVAIWQDGQVVILKAKDIPDFSDD